MDVDDADVTRGAAAFEDAVLLWRIAPGTTTQEVIDTATECLVVGLDSPTLRELAGASATESQWVLEPLIVATVDELGMSRLFDLDLQGGALGAMCRRLEEGRITPRELASWAYGHVGYDGAPECRPLVDLDDAYDVAEHVGHDEAVLDEWTRQEAAAFLAGVPSPGPPAALARWCQTPAGTSGQRLFSRLRARWGRHS